MSSFEKTQKEKEVKGPPGENKFGLGAESDDVDDIELVFTTGETDPSSIHEDLVPIVEANTRRSLPNIVETDISMCGVLDDSQNSLIPRRNTLPNPLSYQPILHREILAASRMAPARNPSKALPTGTQESSAQTDITAVPTKWKSETSLVHKMSGDFTPLPSKFSLPISQLKRLLLSDKTHKARRVLLSDINFTSMVPELSRSADHLHDEKKKRNTNPKTSVEFTTLRAVKCCDSIHCEGSYEYSTTTSSESEESYCPHLWKSFYIVCRPSRRLPASIPSTPVKCIHRRRPKQTFCRLRTRKKKEKVYFYQQDPNGQSLPNLKMNKEDSGDSTDSLVAEAEEFIRRSLKKKALAKKLRRKRCDFDTDSDSNSEPSNASQQPQQSEQSQKSQNSRKFQQFEKSEQSQQSQKCEKSQPFLPKTINELTSGCFVKAIIPGGKIAVGKVKCSGLVPKTAEPFVGVELVNNFGFSDGCFTNNKFFDRDLSHAIYVPFQKVVMAWKA